jgi:hypothetical protein
MLCYKGNLASENKQTEQTTDNINKTHNTTQHNTTEKSDTRMSGKSERASGNDLIDFD